MQQENEALLLRGKRAAGFVEAKVESPAQPRGHPCVKDGCSLPHHKLVVFTGYTLR
jgi:hypothetical protein